MWFSQSNEQMIPLGLGAEILGSWRYGFDGNGGQQVVKTWIEEGDMIRQMKNPAFVVCLCMNCFSVWKPRCVIDPMNRGNFFFEITITVLIPFVDFWWWWMTPVRFESWVRPTPEENEFMPRGAKRWYGTFTLEFPGESHLVEDYSTSQSISVVFRSCEG